jgi:hypothetical protein
MGFSRDDPILTHREKSDSQMAGASGGRPEVAEKVSINWGLRKSDAQRGSLKVKQKQDRA